jgi:hypothetical protein
MRSTSTTGRETETPRRPRSEAAPRTTAAAERETWQDRAEAAVPALVAAVLLAGAALRVAQYLSGRSLWFDESLLAINVLDRSPAGLLEGLDFAQGAPLGFLVFVKLSASALGPAEWALRLVPLLAGLAALPLFYVVARRLLPPMGALVGLVLFASADGLIYYSSEFKQYSLDVAVAVGLLALLVTIAPAESWRRMLAFSACGAVGLWLSHPAVFVLGGIFLGLGVEALLDRRWDVLKRLAIVSTLWLASFGVFVLFAYRGLSALGSQLAGSDVFVRPFDGGLGLGWAQSLFGAYAALLALPAEKSLLANGTRGLFAALVVVGAVWLVRKKPAAALALGLPIVLMVMASQLGRYPVFARTALFTLPALVIFFAAGVTAIARLLPPKPGLVAATVISSVVLLSPLTTAAQHVADPRTRQEIEPMLAVLASRWEPGDALYLHWGAQPAFRYYGECECAEGVPEGPPLPLSLTIPDSGPRLFDPPIASNPPGLVAGSHFSSGDRAKALDEIARLSGRDRVWVLYSHRATPEQGVFLEEDLPRRLDGLGVRLDLFRAPRAGLMLYDLSRAPEDGG